MDRPPVAVGDKFLRSYRWSGDTILRVSAVTPTTITLAWPGGTTTQKLKWVGYWTETPKSQSITLPSYRPATPADVERVGAAALRERLTNHLRAESVILTPDQIRRMWAIMEEK